MRNGRHIAITAAIAGVIAAPLAIGPSAARADELSDLRANQQLLQQRLDQLAQVPSPVGGLYGGGPRGPVGVQMVGGSFPRSFLIPGTDTSIRVGGEIREVIDYWFSGGNPNASPQNTTVGDNGQLLSLPLNNNPAGRSRGHSIFLQTPRESKINFETRTPTALGEARTFMEFDWAGSTGFAPGGANPTSVSDNLHPRLRFAYATLGGILGGQANSNFSDPDAGSETIDFGGNVGDPGVVRVPQMRYTMPLAPWGFPGAFSISAETPETDGSTAVGQIASDGSPISIDPKDNGFFDPFKAAAPDVTFAWYIPQPWGHADFSAVVRPTLQIKDGLSVDRTYTGWGLHFSGDVKPLWFGWNKDDITFQAVGGIGIGRYINCSCSVVLVTNYPSASTPGFDPAFRAKLSTAWGGNVGYKHYWLPNLRSTISAGIFHQDLDSSILTAGERGSFQKELISAHVNLIWDVLPFVDVGAEYMWGHRLVVSNAKGDENALIGRFRVRF